MRTLPPVDLPAEANGAAPAPAPGINGGVLRQAMRRLASPVVVVTAEPDGRPPRGATIGSFTSVALDPPLISFNVTRGTRLHVTLSACDRFAVHLLAHDQAEMAAHFADPDLDSERQFAPVATVRAGGGAPPIIEGMLAVLICRRERTFEAGDHTVFVGAVLDAIPGRDAPPLVYHRQSYRTVEGESRTEASGSSMEG